MAMIENTARRNQNIAVFGLGVSGIATASALAQSGVHVTAWDDGAAARTAAGQQGITLADPRKTDWSDMDALVLSPGSPLTHPEPQFSARAPWIECYRGVIEDIKDDEAAWFVLPGELCAWWNRRTAEIDARW